MPKMAGDSGSRRATSLKTYSRRVNRSLPASAAKKTSEWDSITQDPSSESSQRRVLGFGDENHSHQDSSELFHRKRLEQHEPTLNTAPSGSQRQALLEINPNQPRGNSPGPLLGHLQKGGTAALSTIPSVSQRHALHNLQSKHVNKGASRHSPEKRCDNDKNPHPINSLPISDKDIVPGAFESSPSKTRRNNQLAPAPNSSYSSSEQQPTFESLTQHLDKPSKRRRQRDDPGSELPPEAKKVKRSSITTYFKPLPASSSPSTTRSVKIFSDNFEVPSSPPTSPLSGGESPQFRNSRRRSRRNLSIKPSLPTITMSYDEETSMSFAETVGNIDDDARVEAFERVQDYLQRQDLGQSLLENRLRGTRPTYLVDDGKPYVTDEDNPQRLFISEATPTATRGTSAPTARTRNDFAPPTMSEIDRPVPRSKPMDIPGAKQRERKNTKYIQQQFVTSKTVNIQCPTCGFTYNRTLEKEVKEHARWHRDHDGGNHPLRGFEPKVLWKENIDYTHRILVGRRRTMKERLWFDNALVISKRGLDGALPKNTWEQIIDPSDPKSGVMVDRYKVYVYTIDEDVVSVILAERIAEAGAYYCGPKTHTRYGKLAKPDPTQIQEYVDMDRPHPVKVSVDRIWTDEPHQRNRFAAKLLDYVRQDFIRGLPLHKCQVAFSFPTTAGMEFATGYCGNVFNDCPFVVSVGEARMVVKDGKYTDTWAKSPTFDQGTTFIKDDGNEDWY